MLRNCVVMSVLATAVLGGAGGGVTADDGNDVIDVVSFNVLGPIWADASWYPEIDDHDLLSIEHRRPLLTAYLDSITPHTEIVCLQEVTDSEYQRLADALGDGYVGMMASNDEDYWSNWLIPPLEWEPNGTALFVRSNAFSDRELVEVDLGTGNRAVEFRGTSIDGHPVAAWSVHLDSDSNRNRLVELDAVLARSGAAGAEIMCGDFNEDTRVGSAAGRVKRAGFVDVLDALDRVGSTHPWSETYNHSRRWAVLDHVVVRGATPIDGRIEDAGVGLIADEATRIEEFLRRMGSDHYAIAAAVALD